MYAPASNSGTIAATGSIYSAHCHTPFQFHAWRAGRGLSSPDPPTTTPAQHVRRRIGGVACSSCECHHRTNPSRLVLSPSSSFAHLVGRPEEVAAERHHPALVGLLQQLGRVLGCLRGEGVVVGRVEALAREQRPRHRHQRSHLRLAVGKLVFVQDERLPSVTDRPGPARTGRWLVYIARRVWYVFRGARVAVWFSSLVWLPADAFCHHGAKFHGN